MGSFHLSKESPYHILACGLCAAVDSSFNTSGFYILLSVGWTGLFCPCVLFGRNVERLRDDTPWTTPCVCHAIFVEGGIALAAATAVCHGIDPGTSFLIGEGLLFGWWMCGIYTGLFRQSLQKKYHLKVTSSLYVCVLFMLNKDQTLCP